MLLLVAGALAGCGGHGGSPSPPPSIAGFRACLDRNPVFSSVRALPLGQAGRTVLSPRDRGPVVEASRGANVALVARAGGARQVGGTIVESPVRVFELFWFRDPKTVAARGGRLQSAVGRGSFDGARSYGPWLVVHYSLGIDGRAARVGLTDREVAPVTDCLRSTGYL